MSTGDIHLRCILWTLIASIVVVVVVVLVVILVPPARYLYAHIGPALNRPRAHVPHPQPRPQPDLPQMAERRAPPLRTQARHEAAAAVAAVAAAIPAPGNARAPDPPVVWVAPVDAVDRGGRPPRDHGARARRGVDDDARAQRRRSRANRGNHQQVVIHAPTSYADELQIVFYTIVTFVIARWIRHEFHESSGEQHRSTPNWPEVCFAIVESVLSFLQKWTR